MSVIVLLLGILAAGAGLAAIGFAVPNIGTDFGHTLIVAGATGLTGGLILFGLAAAVGQLTRIAEGLRARARSARSPEAPLPPRPEALQPRPEPIPPRAEPVAPRPDMVPYAPRAAPEPRLSGTPSDMSSSAIERLRSALPRPDRLVPEAEEDVPLSPEVNATPQADETPEPMAPVTRPSSEEDTPQRQPRLDFLFRSRATPPSAPPPSSTPASEERSNPFESMWPRRAIRRRDMLPPTDDAESNAAPPLATEPAPPEPRHIAPEPLAAPMAEEAPSVAILKSGVVDGMAYTLYADGSIEAQLPQGTMRFASITELRAHIDTNS
jgi:hypothetical protein